MTGRHEDKSDALPRLSTVVGLSDPRNEKMNRQGKRCGSVGLREPMEWTYRSSSETTRQGDLVSLSSYFLAF